MPNTLLLPRIHPSPSIHDVKDYIATYRDDDATLRGTGGFINSLIVKHIIPTPFGNAQLLADHITLGITGVYVWIVQFGGTAYRIDVPATDEQHDWKMRWDDARIVVTVRNTDGRYIDRTPLIHALRSDS